MIIPETEITHNLTTGTDSICTINIIMKAV